MTEEIDCVGMSITSDLRWRDGETDGEHREGSQKCGERGSGGMLSARRPRMSNGIAGLPRKLKIGGRAPSRLASS